MASEEAATPDLVERVRAIIDAAALRDWDSCLRFFAPDAVWDGSAVGFGTFEGHAAMRGLWEDFAGVYRDWHADLDECHDLGNGIVLAVFTMRGRLAGGGEGVLERGAFLYEWVDGLIVRLVDYRDIDEARADAERLAQDRG